MAEALIADGWVKDEIAAALLDANEGLGRAQVQFSMALGIDPSSDVSSIVAEITRLRRLVESVEEEALGYANQVGALRVDLERANQLLAEEKRAARDAAVTYGEIDRQLEEALADVERLRGRTHEIQAEEMQKRKQLDSEIDQWRNRYKEAERWSQEFIDEPKSSHLWWTTTSYASRSALMRLVMERDAARDELRELTTPDPFGGESSCAGDMRAEIRRLRAKLKVGPENIERAAEAVYSARWRGATLHADSEKYRDLYRGMARAAAEAFRLTVSG